MTREETQIMIASITVCYQKNLMPEISSLMIDTWYMLLSDLDYKETMTAVAALIAENPSFPPTIGAIRGRIAESKMKSMSSADAWQLIREAVKKFGSYQPDEAEKWLGAEIWKTVSRNGWEYFCTMSRDNATTCFAQFRQAYEAEAKYKLTQSQIPESVRNKLEAMRPPIKAPCLLERQQKEQQRKIESGGKYIE